MITIENINPNKIDAGLGLIQNVPKNILSKLGISYGDKFSQLNIIEVTIISGDSDENVRSIVQSLGGTYENLGFGFGIVNIPTENLWRLASSDSIQYIELPKSLYTTDAQSNRAACVNTAREGYNIRGEGVLIGFIDSGIDYTHPAFRNQDGTTRIDYIYDLSDNGKVYNREIINTALQNQDPFTIVPSYDNTEHGTHVAGIACAGGNINNAFYGVAPESSIAMVKCTRGQYALSTNIMRGLKFLVDKGKELAKPLVVNISLSTNDGAHNGSSLLEQYISTIATLERITIAIAAGNEGDAAHHIGGDLSGEKRVLINIAEDEAAVILNLYKPVLSEIAIRIISPTAATSGDIIVREGYSEGLIGRDRYQIFYTGPKPFDLIGEISISLLTNGQYISSGQWEVRISLLNEYTGLFDIWLPISEGLNVNTKFLQPTVLNTLGIPATVSNIIAVGSYNYVTNNISSFSGRGRPAIFQTVRPDLVAPGENISSATPNRSFDTKSGTSMATPHVAGIAALMMEWGVVKRNDPYLYGERLKYYLVTSAKRPRTDVKYPDPSWGYGEVCLSSAIESIIDNIGFIGTRNSKNYRYDNKEIQSNSNGIDYKDITAEENNVFIKLEEKEVDIKNNKYRQMSIYKDLQSEALQNYQNYSEVVGFLIEYSSREQALKVNDIPGASIVLVDNNFGIAFIPFNRVLELEPYVKDVVSIEIPVIYTLEQSSPVEASGAPLFHNNPFIQLNGRGVIVGIIDTGIDYLNSEFMREDETTRIVRIWDQSIEGNSRIYDVKLGVEYNSDQINQAIQANKRGEDPYAIVRTKDDIGHGTMVASLVGARGINPEVMGIAPDCEFAIVKLKQAPSVILDYAGVSTPGSGRYTSIELSLAIRYLNMLASDLGKPMVICLPVGSNIGSHDGTNVVEAYISQISIQLGVVCVTGTGNEGDTDTHTEGRFDRPGQIRTLEIRIGKGQRDLNFQIYIQQPDKVSIGVVSPSGEVVERIPVRLNKVEKVNFIYEGTRMRISYIYPDLFTGDQIISIEAKGLREGIWQFRLYGDYVVDGRYWSWLPQRSLLDPDTKFLSPSQYTTLTIPATARSVIAAAFYNQNNNATIGQSGRGFTRDGRIKPDIAAGGINAIVTTPGGGTRIVSGSSVGTSITAGCCALLMQWGIVNGNDPSLYATEIRTYLIRGTSMRVGDIYPNEQWGYGTINMKGVFDAIRENLTGGVDQTRSNDDYEDNDFFVSKPEEI